MAAKKTVAHHSPEVRERAVRLVLEGAGDHGSRWAAINSIAARIGCTAETLWCQARQAERGRGKRPGPTTEEPDRITALGHESRDRCQAEEILRNASEFVALTERTGPVHVCWQT